MSPKKSEAPAPIFIHPFDMYELLDAASRDGGLEVKPLLTRTGQSERIEVKDKDGNVAYVFESEIVEFKGQRYVQTTNVPPKTHAFDKYFEESTLTPRGRV